MALVNNLRKVVVVDGCRIPFQRSGTGYKDLIAYDLGRLALKGLLHRTQLHRKQIDCVIMGTVVADVTTSNVAREITLGADLGHDIPAYTITMACISSNRAVTDAVEMIACGRADVVIAGGTDTVSDFPIRFRKQFRKRLLASSKYRSLWDFRKFLRGLRFKDLLPEIPDITEFSTNLSMGQSCERIAAKIGVTREEQDEYALRSHSLAAKADKDGRLRKQIYPLRAAPKFQTIQEDNGIRHDSSLEKLQKLRPAFERKYGTITAGNSSFLTDGASAVVLMAEEVAKSSGYRPHAYVRDYCYTGHDPLDELLLGPAFAVPKLLDSSQLKLSDIDVFEFHEAFAAQVLAVLKCLDSNSFAAQYLQKGEKVGEIPLDKLNTMGGSLSIGHPFGATGARLVMTAAQRLQQEDGQLALIASCAAGAQGHAMVLERYH